jgi:Family of unknown function (DUF5686)/CarboxypepD_reg-like domain
MRIFLFLLSIIFSQTIFAQKIYGTIFNSQGDLLPFTSVTIKGTTKGASANDRAKYAINVLPGTYTVICQRIGHTTQEKSITITDADKELTFILEDQKLSMDVVIVKSGAEDPAYEIIRSAIKKRNYFSKQVDAFTCNLYSKDLVKLKSLPKKVFGKKIESDDKKEMGVDSIGRGIIYLSESQSKVSVAKPDKFKLQVMSSRVSGSDGFGFSFPSFISLYNNNVKVFTEKFNPRGFISPIADGAIRFYKFKFLGTIFENGKSLSSIRVTPRRKYEPLFSGIINIVDEEWSIHSFDLLLTKTAQLELVDTLQITQLHVPVDATIRRVKNQLIHFDANLFGVKMGGNFVNVYSDYDVKPKFDKKYFDNIIIKYDTGVNKKSVAYWDSTRAVPLEKEEAMDYQKKDSSFKANKDSMLSKKYIDSVNRSQRKIKVFDMLTKGIGRFHSTKKGRSSWRIEPLINPFSPNVEYNPAEGIAVNLKARFSKFKNNSRTGITFLPVIRYGFGNTHLNPSATVIFNTREQDELTTKLKRYSLAFSGGKRVSDFNKEGAYTPFRNTISTLLYGKNYLKTYENYFASVGYNRIFESGLRFSTSLLFEDRLPLENTSDYTFKKSDGLKITPNYPFEKITQQFDAHQALIFSATISFKPGQKYIQMPYNKIPIGSKYPTFTLNYTKGIKGLLGSDVDLDKWKFTVQDDKNLKLAGTIKYKFGVGGFLNRKQVFIQDFQHFNGNQTIAASTYANSFQLAPFYANSTTESFYAIGHIDHHFNGFLTNKIPLFRKLNWNLVAGSNAFYVNKNNNYIEVFGGIENIFKTFRVDFVGGYQGNKVLTGIRIGAGGLLGGSISSAGSGNVSISL